MDKIKDLYQDDLIYIFTRSQLRDLNTDYLAIIKNECSIQTINNCITMHYQDDFESLLAFSLPTKNRKNKQLIIHKSTRHFPACSHNFPKAGEARFQGLSRLFRLLGKFPYLGESRRILMAVSSKTSSKTRFYYAATRRISSAAVQPSIWA